MAEESEHLTDALSKVDVDRRLLVRLTGFAIAVVILATGFVIAVGGNALVVMGTAVLAALFSSGLAASIAVVHTVWTRKVRFSLQTTKWQRLVFLFAIALGLLRIAIPAYRPTIVLALLVWEGVDLTALMIEKVKK